MITSRLNQFTKIFLVIIVSWIMEPGFTHSQVMNNVAEMTNMPVYVTGANLGAEIAISGNYAIALSNGNYYQAYIYERNNQGTWTWSYIDTPPGVSINYGSSVDISGEYAIIGDYVNNTDENDLNFLGHAGAAFIFKRDSANHWSFYQKLVVTNRENNDSFGYKVSIHGDYVLASSVSDDDDENEQNEMNQSGSVYVFKKGSNGFWSQTQKLVASDRKPFNKFGESIHVSEGKLIIGTFRSFLNEFGQDSLVAAGSAYIYEENTSSGIWEFKQKLAPLERESGDFFGYSVAILGNRAIVSAINEDHNANGQNFVSQSGSVYVYNRDSSGHWNQSGKLKANTPLFEEYFGTDIALNGTNILIGAKSNGPNGTGGRAYLFEESAGNWTQIQQMQYPITSISSHFGTGVDLSDNFAMIGDPYREFFSCSSGGVNIYEYCRTRDSIEVTACNQYTTPSGNHTWSQSGVYSETFTNAAGCDSIIVTNLTILHSGNTVMINSACDSYTSPSGLHTWTSSGTYTDTLANASINGCDSIIVIHLTLNNNSSTEQILSCNSYYWPVNGTTYNQSGTYTTVLENSHGCDSTVTLQLTINSQPIIFVTQSGNTLTTTTTGTYQWINCNGSEIVGATSSSFTPASDGNYAVIVTQNACSDTSFCFIASGTAGINESLTNAINLYPNPVSDIVSLELPGEGEYTIELVNSLGVTLSKEVFSGKLFQQRITGPKGIYFFNISDSLNTFTIKFSKITD